MKKFLYLAIAVITIFIVLKIGDVVISKKIATLEAEIENIEKKNDSLRIISKMREKHIKKLEYKVYEIRRSLNTDIDAIQSPDDTDSIRSILNDPEGYGYRVFVETEGKEVGHDSLAISRVKGGDNQIRGADKDAGGFDK